MEKKYICTFWGKENLSPREFVLKAKKAGYDGVEMNVPFDEAFVMELKSALEEEQMLLVAQQWLPPEKETVDEYMHRMSAYLKHLIALNPLFINSHTGKDFFSFDDNCRIIEECNSLSKESGIRIIHETHRGRFAHHAYSVLPYLDKFSDIGFNADFSHFCLVSESLLEDQDEVINKIIPHCQYIHARVGFDQTAQVNHPFAPEWKSTVERFVGWWKQILKAAESKGEETFYICPEFGPYPYMPEIPFTKQPISNQWDINKAMMEYLKTVL